MLEIAFSPIPNSKVPYYEQLYLFIRKEIEQGHIQAGIRLPSVRSLAHTLGVSTTTVEEAYQQLCAEGYLQSRPKVGFYAIAQDDMVNGSDRVSEADFDKSAETRLEQFEIDFHPARVDKTMFPINTLRKVMNAVWQRDDLSFLDYGDGFGEWGLRQQLADYLYHARGVTCQPYQIVVGSGIQYSVQMIVYLLRDQLTGVATEHPGYDKVSATLERSGVPIHPIPLQPDGLDIDALRSSHVNLVYVTPSHQYPLGMVMPYTKRLQLLQWAKECSGIILEDDYDGEFRYGQMPIPSLQSLRGSDSVIYIGTFSKSLAPSLRMNYMVLPDFLVQRLRSQIQHWDCPVPRYHQIAIQQFMELGHWEKHVRRMRRMYRDKHAALLEAVRSEFGDQATIAGQGAGLHVTLKVRLPLTAKEMIQRAESHGVRIYLSEYKERQHTDGQPVVLLGFGGLTKTQLVDGIRRLRQAWCET